jgi:hypothetical protein
VIINEALIKRFTVSEMCAKRPDELVMAAIVAEDEPHRGPWKGRENSI